MSGSKASAVIVGGGIFGVTAALELRQRGWSVRLVDPGPLPHPLAASTDISKTVRLEYGADRDYQALMEQALDGWREWNQRFGEDLYHETGVLFARQTPMAPGTFEHESYQTLRERGHAIERVDSATIQSLFPEWNADRYVDGTYNPRGGYAESGRVVERLVALARAKGIEICEGTGFHGFIEDGARIAGIKTTDGQEMRADRVVMAVGSWTPHVLPDLAGAFRSVGMPVFHLRPGQPERFAAPRFPCFGADISRTGYYGFPANADGVVKIANHGIGREMHPESLERAVTTEEIADLRQFLAETFPGLADAPLVYTRVCLYCDTRDGHFWIAADPGRPGLVVSTGGSGHGFKFAPVLGALTADAVEGIANPILSKYRAKFRWRPELQNAQSEEAARRKG